MKRKRGEVPETSPSGTDGRPKRRRNDTTLLDTIQYVFDCLRNKRKVDDDVYLCEAFLRVPRKKTEPQYFEVVKQPIDMLKIQQKIKTDQYDELQNFCDDIKLLVDNAKLYYAKSTDEYKDACQLWELYEESRLKAPDEVKEKQKQKQQQLDDEEKFTNKKRGGGGASRAGTNRGVNAALILEEGGPSMDQVTAAQELFGAIITARDSDDRLLSYVFRVLPSIERYPEYYTVITKPIDLRTIAKRLCSKEYQHLDTIVADFDLLFNNACQFNEPGSCIFKDACKLRKLVHLRRNDLMEVINSGKGRLRCRKAVGGGEWHELLQDMEENTPVPLADEEQVSPDELPTMTAGAATAAEDEENDDDDVDAENPLWQLFLLAKNLTVPSNPNYHLIEPFRRLPNRRWHADYYSEIRQAISMSQIRNKIKRFEYGSLSELHQDFNLMLNNAQQYNRPDSRIHRDAVTIQAAIQTAVTQALQTDPSLETSVPVRATMSSPQTARGASAMPVAAVVTTTPVRGAGAVGSGHKTGKASRPSTPVAASQSAGIAWSVETDSEGEDSRQSVTSNSSGKRRVHHTPGGATGGSQLTFKRRAKLLFKTLMDYMTEDGRQPIVAFIEKPSRREYPDYYQVIEQPIDMETIETRIKSEHYSTEKELLADFRLMLKNCITYNEEGSIIHKDAQTLVKVLSDKVTELNQSISSEATSSSSSTPTPAPVVVHTPAPPVPQPVTPAPSPAVVPITFSPVVAATAVGVITPTPSMAQSSKVLQLKKTKPQPAAGIIRNVKFVYNSVRDYKDGDGRQISDVFMKLPSKVLYPDYYELIKHPIDLERVLYKWKSGMYNSVDDCLADLTLLFNNACRYNEPESQIYRDALTLQQIAMQKRLELVWQDSKVPRVRALVQELLMSLFITVFNHEEDSRYTAESFVDIPTHDPATHQQRSDAQSGNFSSKNRPLTFDILKRRLDKGLYSRLDHFQEDLFSVFTRARRLSSLSSRVYKDSIKLQRTYIRARDKVCGGGKILRSQALKFTEADLDIVVKDDRANRPDEMDDSMDTAEDRYQSGVAGAADKQDSIQHNEVSYAVGEFVYVQPVDQSLPKRILHIQRVFRDNNSKAKGNNVQMIQGFQYFRPEETFHPSYKKFYTKEVFKTEKHLTFPVTDVMGKCLILFITDYLKLRADTIPEEDVYVCESRYMARCRFFRKIKMVPFNIPISCPVTERETPLNMVRVDSIFKERMDRHKEELAEVDDETRVQRNPLPNVARTSSTGSGELEFEQYNLGSGAVVKLGDFVYVKVPPIIVPGSSSNSTSTLKAIRHVSRIWINPQGVCSFLGSVYSTAQELYMSGVQLDRMVAYKQEAYLTSVQDSLPLTDITGRCSVLHVKEYAACRLTEVLEKDVYMCQNYFDEATRRISSLQNNIATFPLSRQVVQDELYYFSNAVNLQKAVLETVNLAQLPRRQPPPQPQLGAGGLVPLDDDLSTDLAGEDSMDSSAAPSRSSGSTPPPPPAPAPPPPPAAAATPPLPHTPPHPATTPSPVPAPAPATPTPTPKSSKKGRKMVSGYLLFSSEIRKSVTVRNPSANFGEISRMVGTEWKMLVEVERKGFEDRAHIINKETAEKALLAPPPPPEEGVTSHPAQEMPLPTSPDVVYECMWGDCDIMFEDLADMYDHLLNEQIGHVYKVGPVFECQWRNCSRQKKNNLLPFPLMTRLTRHTKEVHLIKNTGRVIRHQDRSRNFVSSSRRTLINAAAAAATAAAAAASAAENTVPASSLPGFTLGKGGFQVSVVGSGSGGAVTGLAGLLQPQRPQPIFVATPPKTQRLLHSEAYIKYIENLDKPYQSNWDRHLNATMDFTTLDSNRLPTHWLHEQLYSATPPLPPGIVVPHPGIVDVDKDKKEALQQLWALRNLMMKDALVGRM